MFELMYIILRYVSLDVMGELEICRILTFFVGGGGGGGGWNWIFTQLVPFERVVRLEQGVAQSSFLTSIRRKRAYKVIKTFFSMQTGGSNHGYLVVMIAPFLLAETWKPDIDTREIYEFYH